MDFICCQSFSLDKSGKNLISDGDVYINLCQILYFEKYDALHFTLHFSGGDILIVDTANLLKKVRL